MSSRRTGLYQMYDIAAQSVAGPIMMDQNDKNVVRNFYRLLADKNTQPGLYPAEYCLYKVGEQDLETGTIETAYEDGQSVKEYPLVIARGTDWIAAQPQEN